MQLRHPRLFSPRPPRPPLQALCSVYGVLHPTDVADIMRPHVLSMPAPHTLCTGSIRVPQSPLQALSEDTDLHVRELAFAARQYAAALAGAADDYDSLYNHGLVLQVRPACLLIHWGRAAREERTAASALSRVVVLL